MTTSCSHILFGLRQFARYLRMGEGVRVAWHMGRWHYGKARQYSNWMQLG